ncbi:MAG: hypothetical protein JOZ39_04425 [Chloroflexi bacterium]|nr:hypothetical protein [Chloroflexota bacterium]
MNGYSGELSHRAGTQTFQAGLVLIRVTVIIAGWLLFFVLTFVGYLTLPAVVLFGFLVVYTAFEYLARRRRRRRLTARR